MKLSIFALIFTLFTAVASQQVVVRTTSSDASNLSPEEGEILDAFMKGLHEGIGKMLKENELPEYNTGGNVRRLQRCSCAGRPPGPGCWVRFYPYLV
jgi:hypothetical protein